MLKLFHVFSLTETRKQMKFNKIWQSDIYQSSTSIVQEIT